MNNSVVIFYSNVWPAAMWDGFRRTVLRHSIVPTAVAVRKSPIFAMECARRRAGAQREWESIPRCLNAKPNRNA